MRGTAVMMPEAAVRVTMIDVVMHGMIRRRRLLRESRWGSDRGGA
jgi:hypothetical protein